MRIIRVAFIAVQLALVIAGSREGVLGVPGHGAGGVMRSTWVISSRKSMIRWISPESAHWSGTSACRIVTFGPVVIWQSSNSARTAGLACPAKEIS